MAVAAKTEKPKSDKPKRVSNVSFSIVTVKTSYADKKGLLEALKTMNLAPGEVIMKGRKLSLQSKVVLK